MRRRGNRAISHRLRDRQTALKKLMKPQHKRKEKKKEREGSLCARRRKKPFCVLPQCPRCCRLKHAPNPYL